MHDEANFIMLYDYPPHCNTWNKRDVFDESLLSYLNADLDCLPFPGDIDIKGLVSQIEKAMGDYIALWIDNRLTFSVAPIPRAYGTLVIHLHADKTASL